MKDNHLAPDFAAEPSFAEQVTRAVWVVLASPFYGLASGALFPLVALSMQGQSASPTFIGATAAAYYAGSFLGSLTFGAVIRVLGLRNAFALAMLIGGVSAAAFALPLPLMAWLLLRLGTGFSAGAFYMAADAWLGGLTTPSARGRIMGTSEALRIGCMAIGPYLVVMLPEKIGFLAAGALLLLAVLPTRLAPLPAGLTGFKVAMPSLRFFREHAAILGMIALVGAFISSFNAASAIAVLDLGVSHDAMALFVGAAYLAGGLNQVLFGAIGDVLHQRSGSRLPVAISAAAIAAAVAFALPWMAGWATSTGGIRLLIGCGALLCGFAMPLYSVSFQRLIDTVRADQLLQASGSALLAYNITAIAGAFGSGVVLQWLGATCYFHGLGLVLTAAAILALAQSIRK